METNIKNRLLLDLKNAMKSKDVVFKNTIQSLRASILQYEIDKKVDLDNNEDIVIDIINKEKKKRLDTLEQIRNTDRKDLIEQTEKELLIISKYLPEQLTIEQVEQEIEKVITELNATQKDFGKVMKELTTRLKNKTDGKTISNIVKDKLK